MCVMARVNVYLPDELAAAARAAEVNLSAVVQDAVRALLDRRSTDAWLDALPLGAERRTSHDEVLSALDAARDDPPTRHG